MLAYLRLMLQNRLASLKPKNLQREGRGKFGVAMGYFGYVLLFVFLYGVVVFLEMMMFEASIYVGDSKAVVALTFLLCTIVILLYGFFNVVGLLFFNKDNGFIAALPISSRGVLTAKLVTVLIGEIGLTLAICLPLVIRYGIYSGLGIVYYLRALLGMIFIPVAPIAIAVLLAFLLIRASALWKRREGMTIVMTFLLMGGILAAQMSFTMNITDEQMTSMILNMFFGKFSLTEMVQNAYPPLRWLSDAMTGSGIQAWGNLLMFVGLSVAALGMVVGLFGGGYMRLALKQEETLRRANAGKKRVKGKERVRTPLWALYRREMRDVITVPVYATNCLTGSIMFPVLIVILMLGMQQQSDGAAIAQLLMPLIPRDLFLAVVTGGLSFTVIMGLAVATAVSREGRQHDYRRLLPVAGSTQLMAKLMMGMTYNAITTVLSAIALWILMPLYWVEILIGLIVSQLFSLLWCAAVLLLDVYHPRLKWKTETEAVKQSMNTLYSMLIGIAMLAAIVGAYWLCLKLGLSMTLAFVAVIAILAIATVLMLKWLRGKGAMTYSLREYSN